MTDDQLKGKPLRYLIGADADAIVAHAGEIVEMPFDWNAAAPTAALGIKYCNLFNENYGDQDTATRVSYGPYLTSSDTAIQYDEGQIDPHGAGWTKNLTEQFARAQAQGFLYIELDNPDAYSLSDVMGAIALAETYGLKVIAKNPGLTYGGDDATQAVAHPNVAAIIVEKDCGTPADMDAMCYRAGKPDLPVWFVYFGDGATQASKSAAQITSSGYLNMGVTFSSKGEYGSSEDILLPIAAHGSSVQPQPSPPMTDAVPPSLALARTLVGKVTDGPSILPLATAIAQKYPDMAAYCGLVTPTTSWCGLFAGYCLAMNGIRPPYNPKVDVESFLWARAWLLFGTPVAAGSEQLGDILVFDFGGGDSHVTQYDGVSGANYLCLGGNQSDAVNVQSYPKTKCIGIRRPPAAGAVAQPVPSGPAPLPDPDLAVELQSGAVGAAVLQLQTLLGGIAADGEFGPDTDAAVRAYQTAHGLGVDGVVGPATWASLLGSPSVKPAPATAIAGALSADVIAKITTVARNSPARSGWSNGTMPVGCINGLAVSYGIAYRDLKAGTSAALAMARPLGATSTDALAWYGVTATDPVSLLRADFQLLFGSAMRESSGNYSEGRDMSASNVQADTAEAGLFQQSWNSHVASPELPKLLAQWSTTGDDGLLPIFREGVSDKQSADFGSGDGALFQQLCKTKPLFAVYCAAIGQRVLRAHWGPISRHEAQMRPEVDVLLQQVQQIVDAMPATAPPPLIGVILHPDDPGPVTQPAPVNQTQQLLQALFLNLLLGGSKMADQTGLTPGALLDNFNKAFLPMAINAITTGKQISGTDIMSVVTQGIMGLPIAGPTPIVTPAAGAAQPQGMDGVMQQFVVQQLLSLHNLLQSGPLALLPAPATSGTPAAPAPAPVTQTPPVVPVVPAPLSGTPSWMINLGAGLASTITSLGLSGANVMGTAVGPNQTMTGLLVTLAGPLLASIGVPSFVVKGLGGAISAYSAFKAAQKAAPAPVPAPPVAAK